MKCKVTTVGVTNTNAVKEMPDTVPPSASVLSPSTPPKGTHTNPSKNGS